MRVCARFGDDDFIAAQEIDIIGTIHMVTKEDPKQQRPREHCGKKALDSAIAAAFASPAREPSPGDPPRYGHHSDADTTQLAYGGGCDVRTGTLEQCYNVNHR